jgi:uncharacterized GH25 family protein
MRFHTGLLFFCLAGSMLAHDLYLSPRAFVLKAGQTSQVEFHNGDAFPESQVPPRMERLRDVEVRWASGKSAMKDLKAEANKGVATFTAPSAAGFQLTTRTIPNFLELDPAKFEEYLNHEGLEWVVDWRKKNGEATTKSRELYSKYVKSIIHTGGADPFVTKPVGFAIEFVPDVDPITLKAGQKLGLQVLFQGKPAPAGIRVEASSYFQGKAENNIVGRTDAKGRIEVPLNRPGLWKLHAIHMIRLEDRKQADWESFWASLTFELPAKPQS